MARLGTILILLGVGSFILPLFGLQFRLLSLFGDAQPIASVVMAVVGVLLLVAQVLASRAAAATANK